MKKPPMFLLLTIVLVTIAIAYKIVSVSRGHWRAILLVIVYVRGVIVLFIYVASLSPYEKNKSKNMKWTPLIVLALLVVAEEVKQRRRQRGGNIFKNRIRRLRANLTIATILSIIATIVPKIVINIKKGIKSSK